MVTRGSGLFVFGAVFGCTCMSVLTPVTNTSRLGGLLTWWSSYHVFAELARTLVFSSLWSAIHWLASPITIDGTYSRSSLLAVLSMDRYMLVCLPFLGWPFVSLFFLFLEFLLSYFPTFQFFLFLSLLGLSSLVGLLYWWRSLVELLSYGCLSFLGLSLLFSIFHNFCCKGSLWEYF